MGGDDNDFGGGADAADEFEEFKAIAGRIHAEVGNDEVEIVFGEKPFGVVEVVGLFHRKCRCKRPGRPSTPSHPPAAACALGHARDSLSHHIGVGDFIVDDEDSDTGNLGLAHGAGL